MAQPETDLVQSIAKWLQHFKVPFASSVLTLESSRRGLSRLITSGEAAVIVLATIFENDISSEADRQQQESQALYNRALTVATNARSHREAESNIVNHPGSTTVSAHSVKGSIRLQCWATAFALLEHLAGVTVNVEEQEFIIVGDFGAAMGFLQRLRVLCDHAVIHLTPRLTTVLPSAVIHAPSPRLMIGRRSCGIARRSHPCATLTLNAGTLAGRSCTSSHSSASGNGSVSTSLPRFSSTPSRAAIAKIAWLCNQST
jgi:hypothetical protein